MQKIQWLFIAMIICLASQTVHAQQFEMMHDGIVRTYVVYEPNNLDPNPEGYPLVIGLHGGGSDGIEFIATAFLGQKAFKEKFIVAAPDALRHSQYPLTTRWNAGDGYEIATDGTDDVGFISTLIDTMIANYNVDTSRVYVMGFSNGSMMTYRVADELSHKIAAIGAVSGQMAYEDCNPEFPVPIIHFHGLDDPKCPYEGGPNTQNFDILPAVESVMEIWRQVNDCYSIPFTILDENGFLGRKWASFDGKSDIILYTIEDWGHSWPREGDPGLDATDLIWDFLKLHRRVSVTDSNEWFVFCFEADEEIISTPAIGDDGTIYFGTQNASLYAIDCNGNLKWKWKYEEEDWGPQAFEAAPVIGDDDTIYMADDIAVPTYLFAISPDGEKKWEYMTYMVYGSMDASPVLLSDGTIFAGGYGCGRACFGQLVALTPDGTVLEGFPLHTNPIIASPVAVDDVVIAGMNGITRTRNEVFAVNKSADIIWYTELPGDVNELKLSVSSLAVDHDRNVFIAQNNYDWATKTSSSQIVQLDSVMGQILFEMDIPTESIVVGSPVIDAAESGANVIVATQNGHVISINPDADGEKLNFNLVLGENSEAVGSPVIGDNGKLYHAANSISDANQIDVFEINADGTVNDTFRVTIMNDHVSSSLTMGNNGVLYFGTKKGKLYAVQTDANGLSGKAPWPSFRHDIRNTGNPGL